MLSPPKYKNNLATGMFYFSEGLKLIWKPQLRAYLLVPLVINCILFFVLTSALVHYVSGFWEGMLGSLPSWLSWLKPLAWIAKILLAILLLIVYGYSFNMITNIIAAPFYGILSSKVEEMLTGEAPPEEPLAAMIPRVIAREFTKLFYFLSRGIAITVVMILIATIPLLQLLSPLIGLAWSAWSMAIQYADYAADNNQKNFKTLRNCLWKKSFSSCGFGGVVMLCSVIPLVNIFAMPAAVAGGTLFWLRELKGCQGGVCER